MLKKNIIRIAAILFISFFTTSNLSAKKELTEMSVKQLEKEWKKGNADACYQLGEVLYKGLNGTTPHKDIAIMRYFNAAEMGHPGAQLWLGCKFNDGSEKLISKNESSAISYFLRVINNPTLDLYPTKHEWKAIAASHLGNLFYGSAMWPSENQRNEFDQAIKYFKIAEIELQKMDKNSSDRNDMLRRVYQSLGNSYYMKSIFCEENCYFEELHYRKLGADMGDKWAKYIYASTLYRGNSGIKADKAKAIPILEELSLNSSDASLRAESLFIIGTYYYDNADYSKAYSVFTELLNNGELFADARSYVLMKLASMYLFGRGVEENQLEAERLFKEAYELGEPDAEKINRWLFSK